MDYLKKYGIPKFINAHDTITLYGASRMSEEVYEAMSQISSCFTDMILLQRILGERIARMTHNEGAYIANSAAGAIQLCCAAAMCGDDAFSYRCLPDTCRCRDEILVLHGQYHCYVKAAESTGAKIKLAGDADEVLLDDLERMIGEKTAAVIYTTAQPFQASSPSLKQVAEVAHRKQIPVIVDGAAQLPPVENLWNFCEQGGDMVIFSGGKSIMGPQTSGLIVGKKEYIERCIQYGSPNHGICRSSKASRESMIGLCAALESYVTRDHSQEREIWSGFVDRMIKELSGGIYKPFRVEQGSVGQSYPRMFLDLAEGVYAEVIQKKMYQKRVFVGCNQKTNQIYISPQNLTEQECGQVIRAFLEIEKELEIDGNNWK